MHVVKHLEKYDSTYSHWFTSSEYSQEFHDYKLVVKLDRCIGKCNTLNGLIKQLKQKV